MLEYLFFEMSKLMAAASLAVILLKIIIVLILIFAVIGIISTIRFFAGRKKRKETDGEYWLRTGKMKK